MSDLILACKDKNIVELTPETMEAMTGGCGQIDFGSNNMILDTIVANVEVTSIAIGENASSVTTITINQPL